MTSSRHRSSLPFLSALLLVALGAPAQAQPGSATATGPAQPTEADLAPITIPGAVAASSDFALRLGRACGAVRASVAPAAAARSFQLAPLGIGDETGRAGRGGLTAAASEALAGLHATCDQIETGQRLSAVDLANLRAFRQDPAFAEARIAHLLNRAAATPEGTVTPSFDSVGSLEAQVIAGLAAFIYDRAKQEAVLYLGRELGQRLCTGLNRLFFSDLCLAIDGSDPPLSLSAMGSYLATAARRDLQRLPDKALAYQLFRLPTTAPAAARESLAAARLGLAYFRAVAAGRTPADVARALHRLPATTPGATAMVFGACARSSELLDAVLAQEGWRDVTSATDAVARRYALGAIFSLEDLFREDALPFPAPNPDQIAALVPVVARYLAEARALDERAQRALASLRRPPAAAAGKRGDFTPADGGGGGGGGGGGDGDGGLATRDYLAATAQTLQGTLQAGVVVAQKLGVLTPEAAGTVTRVAEVVELGEQLVWGKSPSEAVIVGLDLLVRLGQELHDPTVAAATGQVIADLKAVVVLTSQIAQAESADEVAKILEAAAAPASTYETKYRHGLVALGALVGASVGVEALRVPGASWSTGGVAGAFAPVGITASRPTAGGRWHYGALLSVINLGALVSTRFSEDTRTGASGATTTVKADPAIKLANVFAPGLFLTLGLYRSPFTLSAGGQVVPQGRQVETAGATSTTAAVQVIATLSVDVPILTF
ncbi:MAG TPA: hypothetical protein VFH68_08965 [Polyangia bacterium]|jgi:hypothetical protein|nr:hypothetical protein [Polyangia bacterium]